MDNSGINVWPEAEISLLDVRSSAGGIAVVVLVDGLYDGYWFLIVESTVICKVGI